MIKRDITETVYEYDKDGKLVRKTITTTHETDDEMLIVVVAAVRLCNLSIKIQSKCVKFNNNMSVM